MENMRGGIIRVLGVGGIAFTYMLIAKEIIGDDFAHHRPIKLVSDTIVIVRMAPTYTSRSINQCMVVSRESALVGSMTCRINQDSGALTE